MFLGKYKNVIKEVLNESLQNNSNFRTNKPLTIIGYHGTMNDFDNFDKKFAKNGFYFASKQRLHSLAGYYAQENGYIIKAKLHFEHPFVGTPSEYQDLYNNHYKEMLSKYDGIITVNDGSIATNSKYYNYKTDKTEEETLNIGDIVEMVVFNPNQIEIIKKVKLKDLNESVQNNLNDNFWKWFKGSKVVTPYFKPEIMYHGSSKEFNEFNLEYCNNNLAFGKGFYFTNDKKLGNQYAGENGINYACYIKLINPYIVQSPEMPFEEHLKKSRIFRNNPNAREDLIQQGYDGVMIKEDDGYMEVVVFNPNQIKSVKNNGEWNPNSNNIYENKLISQLNETIVYAGSGKDYEKPSLIAVGTGEGQIAHGYGLYYAIDPEVAKGYAMRSAIVNADIAYNGNPIIQRDGKYYINNEEISEDKNESLYILIIKCAMNGVQNGIEELKNNIKELIQSIKDDPNSPYNDYKKDMIKTIRKSVEMSKYMTVTKTKGIVHRVEIPDDKYFMDETRFYNGQSSYIRQCLKNVIEFLGGSVDEILNSQPRRVDGKYDGIDIYDYIKMLVSVKYAKSYDFNSAKYASMAMLKFGIKGIKYNGRQDGICYVLFNPNDAKVLDKQLNENIKISH